MHTILTAAHPRVQTSRILFDGKRSTKPRNRIFGFGLEHGPWVRDDATGAWQNPDLFANGPRVEPLPRGDAEIGAYEAGRRCGYGRVESSRILAFHGWSEACVRAFWLGHRLGWAESDSERLEAQAELDRRFDAAYAASHDYSDDTYRVDFGWDAERGGVL